MACGVTSFLQRPVCAALCEWRLLIASPCSDRPCLGVQLHPLSQFQAKILKSPQNSFTFPACHKGVPEHLEVLLAVLDFGILVWGGAAAPGPPDCRDVGCLLWGRNGLETTS